MLTITDLHKLEAMHKEIQDLRVAAADLEAKLVNNINDWSPFFRSYRQLCALRSALDTAGFVADAAVADAHAHLAQLSQS